MVCMFWVQTNACIRCIVWYQVPTTIARCTCYRHDTSFGAWLEVPVVVKCPFSVCLSVLSVNRFRSCWFVDLMSHGRLQRDLGEGARGRSKTWLKTYRHKTIMNTKEHKNLLENCHKWNVSASFWYLLGNHNRCGILGFQWLKRRRR